MTEQHFAMMQTLVGAVATMFVAMVVAFAWLPKEARAFKNGENKLATFLIVLTTILIAATAECLLMMLRYADGLDVTSSEAQGASRLLMVVLGIQAVVLLAIAAIRTWPTLTSQDP